MINELQNYLEKVNVNGLVDVCVINSNEESSFTKVTDNFGMLGVFVKTDKKLFDETFGVTGLSELLKLLLLFDYEDIVEREERLLFKNKNNKLKWNKMDIETIKEIKKEKSDLLAHYSENKITIELTEELKSDIKNILNSNLNTKIEFTIKNSKLILSIGEDTSNRIEYVIIDDYKGDSNQEEKLVFNVDHFTKIFSNNLSENCKMHLDFVGKPIPLHFEDVVDLSDLNIEVDYFITPLV